VREQCAAAKAEKLAAEQKLDNLRAEKAASMAGDAETVHAPEVVSMAGDTETIRAPKEAASMAGDAKSICATEQQEDDHCVASIAGNAKTMGAEVRGSSDDATEGRGGDVSQEDGGKEHHENKQDHQKGRQHGIFITIIGMQCSET